MEITTISLAGRRKGDLPTVSLYKDADVERVLRSLDYRDSEAGGAGGADTAEM